MTMPNKPEPSWEETVDNILNLLEGFHRNQYVVTPKRPEMSPQEAKAALNKAAVERLEAHTDKLLTEILGEMPDKRMIEQFPETITTEWIEQNPHMSTDLGHRNGFNNAIDQITKLIQGKRKSDE